MSLTPPRTADRPATYGDVLRVREFRAMYLAQALSVLGDQVARIGVALLVFGQSNSPLLAAGAYGITFLPWLIGGPLLSAIADRVPRRRVMIICDLVRAGAVALLSLEGVPLWLLFALLFAVSLLAPPFEAARAAMLPDILVGDNYVVGSSLTNITNQLAQVMGFVAGGALVTLVSTRGALIIDASTFLVSALVLLARVRPRPLPPHDGPVKSLLGQSREGIQIVATDPVLRALVLLAWCGAAFSIAPEGLAVVVVAEQGGGPLAVGLLTGALPLGLVVGALVLGRFVAPSRRLRVMLPLAVVGFLPLIATTFVESLAVLFVLWTLTGASTAYMLAANALFVAAVPPAARGRAFGIAQAGLQVVQGLAIIGAGALAEVLEPTTVVGLSGCIGLVTVGAVALRWPAADVAARGAATAAEAAAASHP